MKEKKAIKVHTLLIWAFFVPQVLLVITQVFSYLTVETAQQGLMSDQRLQSFHIFMFIEMVICFGVITGICIIVTKNIRISLESLNAAAKEIARGNVDITLKKRRNDEFGDLVDAFQMVIDNTRYESQIAEE